MSPLRLLLLGGIGLVTGAINTVAGGGSLLSFPALLALGYSPLVANVTNTIGVFPSSAGGSLGYRRELAGQARNWLLLAAICTVGSLLGAWLLLVLPVSTFEAAVPVLIASAALLTLAQPWLARRMRGPNGRRPAGVGTAPGAPEAPGAVPGGTGPTGTGLTDAKPVNSTTSAPPAMAAASAAEAVAAAPAAGAAPEATPLVRRWGLLVIVLLISVYGGYFGAAMGVLLIAVLGLFLHETLQRVNALKTSLAAVVNGVAAVAFAFLGPVVWSAALVLAGTTMVGGMLGALIARRLSDRGLRLAVVAIGLAAAVYSALR